MSASAAAESLVAVTLPGSRSPQDPSRVLRGARRNMDREQVRQNQRDRLIDAIVQVVAEEGYESCKIQTICRRAGVAFNTFYDYFPTKEALFLAAYDAGTEILLGEVARVFTSGDLTWVTRVRAAVECWLQILRDNPAFAVFFSVEAQKAGPTVVNRIESNFIASYGLFGEAQPRSAMGMRAEQLLPLAIGGIYAGLYLYIRTGQIDRLSDYAEDLTAFICALFEARVRHDGGPHPAPAATAPA